MKLGEFITTVLTDIDTGLEQASKKTDRKYFVDVSAGKGVNFDIAVVAGSTSTTQLEGEVRGGLKAGFVEVLGGKLEGKQEDKEENNHISRIRFVVCVPFQTEAEKEVEHQKFIQETKQKSRDVDPYFKIPNKF